ncbi:hypothetical protein DXG01_006287 [Tephrocybe rancida]|nr:hypothetical protein DXG01_006287 [Tephrocybe rancida]
MRYNASPYSVKIDNLLTLKRIPYQKVNVSPVLPRPEITDLLGLTYRRIPVLAIGNDVYCDTSLIASTLERRFPPSNGYGTIFPKSKSAGSTNTGAIKIFAKHYESNVFPIAANLLPWEAFPKPFIQDRSLLLGAPIDTKAMGARQGQSATILASQLALLEEQLNDARTWLFDSESPSLADITVHFILSWVRKAGINSAKALFDATQFPKTLSWLADISNHLEGERGNMPAPQAITGDLAAESIVSSTHEPYDVVGFDVQEAGRLGFNLFDRVQVAPDDSGML